MRFRVETLYYQMAVLNSKDPTTAAKKGKLFKLYPQISPQIWDNFTKSWSRPQLTWVMIRQNIDQSGSGLH
jgi:hypothetical protein